MLRLQKEAQAKVYKQKKMDEQLALKMARDQQIIEVGLKISFVRSSKSEKIEDKNSFFFFFFFQIPFLKLLLRAAFTSSSNKNAVWSKGSFPLLNSVTFVRGSSPNLLDFSLFQPGSPPSRDRAPNETAGGGETNESECRYVIRLVCDVTKRGVLLPSFTLKPPTTF